MINMLFEKFGSMWVSFKALWKVKALPQDEDLKYDMKVSTHETREQVETYEDMVTRNGALVGSQLGWQEDSNYETLYVELT